MEDFGGNVVGGLKVENELVFTHDAENIEFVAVSNQVAEKGTFLVKPRFELKAIMIGYGAQDPLFFSFFEYVKHLLFFQELDAPKGMISAGAVAEGLVVVELGKSTAVVKKANEAG